MPDEVSVQISMRESAEYLAAARLQQESLQGVIESMQASNQTTNRVADVLSETARSLTELGGHLNSDGTTSGMNASLVSDLVIGNDGDNGSVEVLSKVLDVIADGSSELSNFVRALRSNVNAGADFAQALESATTTLSARLGGFSDDVEVAVDATTRLSDGFDDVTDATANVVDEINERADATANLIDDINRFGDEVGDVSDSLVEIPDRISSVGDGEVGGGVDNIIDDVLPTDEQGSDELAEKILSQFSKRFDKSGVASKLGGFGEKLGDVTEILGSASEAGSFAGRLGGVIGGLGEFATVASRALPVLAAVPIAIGAISEGVHTYQDMRDISISQTGRADDLSLAPREFVETWLNETFTGLNEGEGAAIQETLINNRAAFGSDEYNQGYSFARNARLNYGVEADKAAQLYTRAVMRGTLTVNDLNSALEELSKTADETHFTMSELTDAYIKSVESLSGVFGGGAAAEIATDLSKLGLSPDQEEQLSSQIAKYAQNAQYGSVFSQAVTDYMTGESEMDVGTAHLAAVMEMTMQGYGNDKMQQLAYMQLGDTGESLNSLWERGIATGDFSDMKSALEEMELTHPGQYYDVFLPSLQQAGIVNKDTSRPDDIVEDLNRVFKATKAGEGAGLYDEADAMTMQRSVDAYDSTTWGIDPYGYNAQSALRMKADMYSATSNKLRDGDISQSDLQDVMVGLVDKGIYKPEDIKNLSQDALYKIVRETARDFSESDSEDWEHYLLEHQQPLTSAYSEYISKFDDVKTGRQANALAAEITVKFEGSLGEFLVAEVRNTEWKQKNDEGNE